MTVLCSDGSLSVTRLTMFTVIVLFAVFLEVLAWHLHTAWVEPFFALTTLHHCISFIRKSAGAEYWQHHLVWLLHHPLTRPLRKRSDSPIVQALHQMPSHFTLVKDFGGWILPCTYGGCKCNGKKSTVIGTTLPLYVTVTDSDGIAPVLQKISDHFFNTG